MDTLDPLSLDNSLVEVLLGVVLVAVLDIWDRLSLDNSLVAVASMAEVWDTLDLLILDSNLAVV